MPLSVTTYRAKDGTAFRAEVESSTFKDGEIDPSWSHTDNVGHVHVDESTLDFNNIFGYTCKECKATVPGPLCRSFVVTEVTRYAYLIDGVRVPKSEYDRRLSEAIEADHST
jgi:hypothetical protein